MKPFFTFSFILTLLLSTVIKAQPGLLWQKTYCGSGHEYAYKTIPTSDGGFAFVGYSESSDGGYILTGLTNSTDGNVSGFHSGGFFDPDVWVCKVNASGDFQWQRCCGGSGQDEAFNVFELSSGVYVVTAFTYSPDGDITNWLGDADGWIFKVSGSTGIETYNAEMFLKLYPNPANSQLNIDYNHDKEVYNVQITNINGQLLYDNPHFDAACLDINEMLLCNGQYLLKMGDGKHFTSQKFIVAK